MVSPNIDRETIRKVAKNSRIRLSVEEEERLLSDFREILGAFSMLDEAKTEHEPAFHATGIEDHLREDEVCEDVPPDEVIEHMDLHQRFIRGPRMQ